MQKAAIYLRLSKEDMEKGDAQHSRSIENQRCILEAFAKRQGLAIYDIYVDDDYSGLSFERPAFLSMLADASKKCFDVILAKSQSRLSRNMEHAEYLLHDFFPSLGIRFIGVVDGVDTDEKAGKKARQINALVNEWYSEDLSVNIRAVYKRKMQAGEYLGAYAPYGYRKDRLDSHHLVVCEKEACYVRWIYDRYLNGYSANRIAEMLTKREVPTPLSSRKCMEPPIYTWNKSTVQKILSNEVYLGYVQQGKAERRSFKDKTLRRIPKEQWICVSGMHEAIIEKEVFESVQLIRSRKRNVITNKELSNEK